MASILDAVRGGSRREALEALRDEAAAQLDAGVSPRDFASISKRLVDIMDELEAVVADEDGDEIGEAAGAADAAWTPPGSSKGRHS